MAMKKKHSSKWEDYVYDGRTIQNKLLNYFHSAKILALGLGTWEVNGEATFHKMEKVEPFHDFDK